MADHLMDERKEKRQALIDAGVNPYPYTYDKTDDSTDILERFKDLEAGGKASTKVSVAGRIMTLRKMGKATFLHVQDELGQLQVYLREQDVGKELYSQVKQFDIGDFLGAKGTIFKTKKGEVTVYADEFTLLCKSMRPLPEKFHGLKDKEKRFRKRHLDLIMNKERRDLFRKRSIILRTTREILDEKGFMEVETPLLQTQYGGASAKPFKTHINAWDMELFLSISPELYLKRLIIGGYEKVFTICKNFRNEGVDHSHNPEFTMLELYQSYVDYDEMMKLVEEVYERVALKVNGTTKVTHTKDGETYEIDFKAPWQRLTAREAIKQYVDIDIEECSVEQLKEFCDKNKVDYGADPTWGELVIEIFDELVEDKIIQPTHVIDRPKEQTPLCKRHRKDQRYNEQCEPVALGMELANMYSELNDPTMQREMFEEQAEKGRGGDEEAHPMDEDFVEALETGMPPTGGIGWGIDRMAILLLGCEGIRDVILFPTMKPKRNDPEHEDQ